MDGNMICMIFPDTFLDPPDAGIREALIGPAAIDHPAPAGITGRQIAHPVQKSEILRMILVIRAVRLDGLAAEITLAAEP